MKNRGLNAKLRQISGQLSDITEHDTDEKVMVFTDNRALQELCAQINCLLADRREIKADYRKKEISYKKMLSNISHDIKTPLTVILGYLEMMRLADGQNEELRKVEAKAGVEMFTNLSFIIFSSVMLAAFIVGTYKDKTINLMFSYPISRKMILGSQMAAVWIFNFIALVLSKLAIYAALVAVKRFTYISAESIALESGMFYVQILADSAVMISISFAALPVGMLLKSSKAAIIAGVVIVCLTQGNIGSYTLMGNIPFYTVLVILSAVSVFLALYRAETRDV